VNHARLVRYASDSMLFIQYSHFSTLFKFIYFFFCALLLSILSFLLTDRKSHRPLRCMWPTCHTRSMIRTLEICLRVLISLLTFVILMFLFLFL
jgi:hypothetical protein